MVPRSKPILRKVKMIMKNTQLIAVPALMGALFIAAAGNQAQAADTGATLTVDNFTSVTSTPTVSMSPLLADLQAREIEKLDAVTLTVTTNNQSGCKVSVSAADGAPADNKIAPSDIFLKVGSAESGAAAGTFGSYTALSITSADLWNTGNAALDGTDVSLDVKFGNLSAYPAKNGATASYSNTLTFTAVANS